VVKKLIKPIYRGVHDALFRTLPINPFFSKKKNGKPVIYGHISKEHLENPELDNQLENNLKAAGIPVLKHQINVAAYHEYVKAAEYAPDYYGGGLDPEQNFVEKTLEHYVTTEIIDFQPETVFMDIAACTSPFFKIVRKLFGCKETYHQDLIFPDGIHGDRIGGSAGNLPLENASIDAATLHCSLEHFEDNADSLLFQDMERVLKPGGSVLVLPFYIAHEFTNHVDPAFNLLRNHPVNIDEGARLRYCDWYQFFSRHYDVDALQNRILKQAPGLELTIYRVENFREVHPSCYLRWIGKFTRR